MRIVLLTHSLLLGGAERVMTCMANHWVGRGWDVRVLRLARAAPAYELDTRVRSEVVATTLDGLSRGQKVAGLPFLLAGLRETLKEARPDAVISFTDAMNLRACVCCYGIAPLIVSERIHPRFHTIIPLEAPAIIRHAAGAARNAIYRMADRIIVQSQRSKEYLPRTLHERIDVIPNPVQRSVRSSGSTEPSRPVVLAAGRLVRQKRFDLLLEAFARASAGSPEWRLRIFGEGKLRSELERRIGELGLSGRASLQGNSSALDSAMNQADLFVLSSDFEGFPNVLAEAMAAGRPVIATDCPTGPAEMIRPGIDGLLVPPGNLDALADALRALMGDPERRAALASRAPEICERFELETIMGEWERAIGRAREEFERSKGG